MRRDFPNNAPYAFTGTMTTPAKLRALIVDDEPIARRVLREELELQPDIEIAGEADGGRRALEKIALLRPDIVFLDLQMPEMSGFEVIARMPASARAPAIIIVTAYDRHAIEAFEAGAIDYVLKPVSQKRLEKSLERVRSTQRRKVVPTVVRPGKIVGKLGSELFLLDGDEVMAFQAEGDLVWIITTKSRYLATLTLREIENKLTGSSFRRIHRNALVNLDHVKKMAALSSQRWMVTMKNQQEFIVSKRLARNIRELLVR
jgi:two-component system LytT family response regulator